MWTLSVMGVIVQTFWAFEKIVVSIIYDCGHIMWSLMTWFCSMTTCVFENRRIMLVSTMQDLRLPSFGKFCHPLTNSSSFIICYSDLVTQILSFMEKNARTENIRNKCLSSELLLNNHFIVFFANNCCFFLLIIFYWNLIW